MSAAGSLPPPDRADLVLVTHYGPWHPVLAPALKLIEQGRYSEAFAGIDAVEGLAAGNDPATLAWVLQLRSLAMFELGRVEEALAVKDAQIELHRSDRVHVWEMKALADSAQMLFALGRGGEGLTRLGRALWLLEQAAPTGGRYVSAVVSVAASAQAAELYETAAETLLGLLEDLTCGPGTSLHARSWSRHMVEDYFAEVLLEWGLRLDHLGRRGEALPRWERSLQLLSNWLDEDEPDPFSTAMLSLVLAELGRHREALDLAADAIGGMRQGELYREARLCHLAMGVARRGLGDRVGARRELVAADELGASNGSAAEHIIVQQELARLALDDLPASEPTADVRRAVLQQAERLWELRAQRLATVRQAHQREQQDFDRASIDLQHLQDPLTELGNRRLFDRRLDDIVALEPGAPIRPLALILIDVDNFKAVNDEHSHPVGDQVLRAIARVIRANTRDGDDAVRLGGDEFAVFLAADLADATEIARRIHSEVTAVDWSLLSRGLHVTISTGVAAHAPDQTGLGLFSAADRNLYTAKRSGRDQVAG